MRVESNLYRAGDTFYACATPPGGREAAWRTLGEVGIMEARRLRDEFVASIRRSTPRVAPSRLTFGEVATEWLATQVERVELEDLAPRTLEAYEGGLKRYVLPTFGDRPIDSMTADDLVKWNRQMRKRGLALATIRGAWAPLRLILDYAVRHHGVDANPADKLLSHEIPRPGPSRQRFLNRDEIARLLAAAVDPYRPPLAIGIFAGLRVSEILACAGATSTSRPVSSRCAGSWAATASTGRRRPRRAAVT